MKKFLSGFFLLFLLYNSNAQSDTLNMYADTLHKPFIYGVASGDPTTTTIQLWTYAGPAEAGQNIHWEIATDSLFTSPITSGDATVPYGDAYTIKPIATGLQPHTHYYYRFTASSNRHSVIGRTLTAPSDSTMHVNFGVVSCSSIFSGYFNAYRQMARDNSIDLIIHLGDYIYDFVDPQEQVRITSPFPVSPTNLDEWRERQMYYLMDPDLRIARQMHPWVQTWDNHDFKQNGKVGTRAFFEFTPTTLPVANDSNTVYRKISYGIADIFMLDMMNYRNIDLISPDNYSALGFTQYNWLTQQLAASQAHWKIVGSPKMMTQWSIAGLESITGNPSSVLFTTSWDGFPAERDSLLSYIDSANIDNVIVISGDSHFSQTADLPINNDSLHYSKPTGAGSVAVEFMPTSISRGNFDEMGYSPALANYIVTLIDNINPNHIYTELISNGYGLLNLKTDSTIAQYIFCPILQMSDDTIIAKTLTVMNGDNHWKRYATAPTSISEYYAEKIALYPNPTNDVLWLSMPQTMNYTTLEVYDNMGREIITQPIANTTERIETGKLANGMYTITLRAINQPPVFIRFLKE